MIDRILAERGDGGVRATIEAALPEVRRLSALNTRGLGAEVVR
ncbi:hypothetical protein [Rathayibacter tanaceti]|uniref:Uncharacterized protein n=1 Tax=Rathayibacter tanaceti TaxID=1671680 RepID=A0A166D7D0_9MICO|nr:hypothetical protein [Rathayibacter tanaceti]KZX22077.1 hypothetical protein ACH61_00789 [Rathayibacter tanaceti]